MKITITDIAKDTGLSLATISKYLNHKKVLPENRILIENSIEKLGYTPNRIAQGLRAEKTNTIAIVIPSLSNYFWGPITTYIETTLRERGYLSIVYTISSDFQRQQYVINHILNNKVDGVIAVVSYWTEQMCIRDRNKPILIFCFPCTRYRRNRYDRTMYRNHNAYHKKQVQRFYEKIIFPRQNICRHHSNYSDQYCS